MKQISRGNLVVLHVSGVSPEQVAGVIAPRVRLGERDVNRVFLAEGGGTLVSVGDADPGATEVVGRLVAEFGSDKVADASSIKPESNKQGGAIHGEG